MKGIMKSHIIAPVNLTQTKTDLFPNTLPSSTQAEITWRYLPFTRLVFFTTRPML
jgi:hypothetical protein